jgi:hypothetical protein
LSWESVRAQLAEAKQYWLATNHGGGSPHVVPLDGLWVDDVWSTVAARKPFMFGRFGQIRT